MVDLNRRGFMELATGAIAGFLGGLKWLRRKNEPVVAPMLGVEFLQKLHEDVTRNYNPRYEYVGTPGTRYVRLDVQRDGEDSWTEVTFSPVGNIDRGEGVKP